MTTGRQSLSSGDSTAAELDEFLTSAMGSVRFLAEKSWLDHYEAAAGLTLDTGAHEM